MEKSLDCASCHGLPPPLPHPQTDNCVACHSDVVGADNRSIIDRSRHVDGVVDVTLGATTCTTCHGDVNPAPPVDTEGQRGKTTAAGVGAHQTHVRGTARSRAVPCGECHIVPNAVLDPGHLDSSATRRRSRLSGVALRARRHPSLREQGTAANRLELLTAPLFPNGDPSGGSNTAPTWTRVDGTEAACGSCHGIPPPPPHPNPGNPCHYCHQNMAEDDLTFTHPELHVDGIVTFQLP